MSSGNTDGTEGPSPVDERDEAGTRAESERSTFAAGRVDRSSTEVRLAESAGETSRAFPGPWSVRAVVRSPGPHLRVER